MKKTVMCLVKNQTHAESIVKELQSAGFANDDISVLFPSIEVAKKFAHELHTQAPEGALAGAGAGGAVGVTLGFLVGLGALAVPGVGPFVAAGPILAALSGGALGALGGGITGALIGLGIPEAEAKAYEGRIRGGHLLISVHTLNDDQRLHVEAMMRSAGAEDVYSTIDTRPYVATSEMQTRP